MTCFALLDVVGGVEVCVDCKEQYGSKQPKRCGRCRDLVQIHVVCCLCRESVVCSRCALEQDEGELGHNARGLMCHDCTRQFVQ